MRSGGRVLLDPADVGSGVEVGMNQHRIRTATFVAIAAFIVLSSALVRSQGGAPTRFVTPPGQVIAIRAGRLFDSRSGGILSSQVVLIKGDRIADVGSTVTIPPDALVIDLGTAT